MATTITAAATSADDRSARPLPALWTTVTVRAGTVIQLTAVTGGVAAIALAARLSGAPTALRVALLLTGWLTSYLCSHAIAHVAVGRAVGIRFRAYGIRGTDHPENYPPVVRQLMSILPMWSAITDRGSLREAGRWARAAMYAAGETATTLVSIGTAAVAVRWGAPGAQPLLTASVIWAVAASITVTVIPKGDYAKARRALGRG